MFFFCSLVIKVWLIQLLFLFYFLWRKSARCAVEPGLPLLQYFIRQHGESIIIYLCAVCAELLRPSSKQSPDRTAVWVRVMQEGWVTDLQTFVSLPPYSLVLFLSDSLLFLLTLTTFTPPPLPVNFEHDQVCIATHLERVIEAEAEERRKRVDAEARKAPWPCSAVALETVMVTSSFSSISGLSDVTKIYISA